MESEKETLFNLLQVTEQLLFSFPLSEDIVSKYIYMRAAALSSLRMSSESGHLLRMHATAKEDSAHSEKQDEGIYSLKLRLESSHGVTKSFCDMLGWTITIVNMAAQRLKFLLGYTYDSSFDVPEYAYELEKTDRTDSWGLLVSRFKEIENRETSYMKLLSKHMEKQERDFNSSVDELEQHFKAAREDNRRLEKQLEALRKGDNEHGNTLKDLERQLVSEETSNEQAIGRLNSEHKQELERLRESYESEIARNKQLARQQEDTQQFAFQKRLGDLETTYQQRERELLGELEKVASEDSSVVKGLRESNEKLQYKVEGHRVVLKGLSDRVHQVYVAFCMKGLLELTEEDFSRRKNEVSGLFHYEVWQDSVEVLAEADFIGYFLNKLSGDNDWLVQQLNEVSRECDELKSKQGANKSASYKEIMSSLSANEAVMKDFVEARNRLVEQFTRDT